MVQTIILRGTLAANAFFVPRPCNRKCCILRHPDLDLDLTSGGDRPRLILLKMETVVGSESRNGSNVEFRLPSFRQRSEESVLYGQASDENRRAGGEGKGGEEKVPGRERLGDEGYYRSSLAEFASSEYISQASHKSKHPAAAPNNGFLPSFCPPRERR